MSYNPGMNDLMRRAGNRSRAITPSALPNIGQTPAVQAANIVQAQRTAPAAGNAPAPAALAVASPMNPSPMMGATQGSPMAAPPVQQTTMTIHPPGSPADPNHYNYEPQPDGAWRVYPPGVPSPSHIMQASLPRAASTADYKRMREAFMQVPNQQRPQ